MLLNVVKYNNTGVLNFGCTPLRTAVPSYGRPTGRPTAVAAAARPPTGEVRAAPEIPNLNFPALPVPWGLGRPAFFTETANRVGVC